MFDVEIKRERDHFVVYVDGKFFCSANTHLEAVQELEKAGYL